MFFFYFKRGTLASVWGEQKLGRSKRGGVGEPKKKQRRGKREVGEERNQYFDPPPPSARYFFALPSRTPATQARGTSKFFL